MGIHSQSENLYSIFLAKVFAMNMNGHDFYDQKPNMVLWYDQIGRVDTKLTLFRTVLTLFFWPC